VADGASLPLKDESIDAIYSCDLIEHLATPKKVLQGAKRVLKSGGVFLITFPIYYSQQGAHLYDYINIPWCHLFFSNFTLIEATKLIAKRKVLSGTLGIEPEQFLTSVIEQFEGLNKMSIKKFKQLMKGSGFEIKYFYLCGLESKPFLRPLLHIPLIQELLGVRIISILYKP
jgi:ubiquinone/menaquinone biosynthesis C-methylase UbiE